DRDEVAPAKSPLSTSATLSPRIAASRATAAPLIPPPITARSKLSRPSRATFSSRFRSILVVFLEGVALFGPRVGVIVIAAHFPEAAPVLGRELERTHPLRALPSVELRHHQPDRKAVL